VWANFQVIIIYEPTVGSLLSKGLQRLAGTVFAIVLSLICSQIAENSGRGEVYLIPVFLYLGAHVLGFLRQVLFSSVPYHLHMLNVIRLPIYNLASFKVMSMDGVPIYTASRYRERPEQRSSGQRM